MNEGFYIQFFALVLIHFGVNNKDKNDGTLAALGNSSY